MLQPFVKFEKLYLNKLISLKKNYLVSQSYNRGYNHLEEIHKTDILLTDYDDLGQANMHLNAITKDKYAAIIDLTKPKHLQRIQDMMDVSDYQLYWAVIKSADELKKKLDASFKLKLRKYIDSKTTWRIPPEETVNSQFEVTFGELFLILKWRSQKVRLKFEEIERF